MRTGLYSAAASAAILVVATQAGAATIGVDEFTTPQRVSDVPGMGLQNDSQVAASTAIGGFRDLQVSNDQDSTDGTELRVRNGELSFSNNSLQSGEGAITYDGDDSPTSLDKDGLGGIDLTAAGDNPVFNFDVVQFDASLIIQVDAFDTTGGSSTYTETLPEAENFSPILPFTDFEGDVDFSDIGALQFSVQSETEDLDGTLTAINVEGETPTPAPIPVPASALLLMGGLGGLPLLRSFRRKG